VNALDANALATKYGTYLAPPPAAPLATTPDDRLSSPPPVSALFSRTRIEADADSIEAILS
jgi:hypothetical protein